MWDAARLPVRDAYPDVCDGKVRPPWMDKIFWQRMKTDLKDRPSFQPTAPPLSSSDEEMYELMADVAASENEVYLLQNAVKAAKQRKSVKKNARSNTQAARDYEELVKSHAKEMTKLELVRQRLLAFQGSLGEGPSSDADAIGDDDAVMNDWEATSGVGASSSKTGRAARGIGPPYTQAFPSSSPVPTTPSSDHEMADGTHESAAALMPERQVPPPPSSHNPVRSKSITKSGGPPKSLPATQLARQSRLGDASASPSAGTVIVATPAALSAPKDANAKVNRMLMDDCMTLTLCS
jgi:sulfur transfer complex TusBCD TusB component (DsrH family)